MDDPKINVIYNSTKKKIEKKIIHELPCDLSHIY